MVNLRPLKEQYVVSRVKETESKIGSFYIPDQAQEKPCEGIVEAIPVIGEPQVAKGDRVLFGKYSGIEVKFAGETYVILKEEDILAVVAEPTTYAVEFHVASVPATLPEHSGSVLRVVPESK